LASADILKDILGCLNLQFEKLDSVYNWREGAGFIREEDDPAILSILGGIDCYAGLLSGMVRDPNGLTNAPFQTLTQWTTGNGVSVSLSLGQLQRCILWELANHGYNERKKAEAKAQEPASPPQQTDTPTSMEIDSKEKPVEEAATSGDAAPAESATPPQKIRPKAELSI